jgi:glycosyltransferase involved in cell wall biosynthesis
VGYEILIPRKRLSGISTILPAYNEEENVERTVDAARTALQACADSVEIIVVNDGSRDRTAAIIDRLARDHCDVIAVHHPQNRGYGAALRSGFSRASREYVFFTDSDLQFDLEEIKLLIAYIADYDIVAGYRRERVDPWHRRVNAFGWNLLVRCLLGLKVRDIDCAFKLFRRRVFDTIRLNAVGAMVNTEILSLAIQQGFTLYEVPVTHYARLKGAATGANLHVIVKAFSELFRMYGKLRGLRSAMQQQAAALSAGDTARANEPN